MEDRSITIAVGASRTDTNWRNQTITVTKLFERLKTPVRGTETLAQYLAYPKHQQDALKDVGGFVAGKLNGGRRKVSNVAGRDVITLDMDTIPPFETDKIINTLRFLGVCFCVYSTRKHTPEHPRLRILCPLSRTVSVDEYEPVARRLAEQIGINMADPTTFEPNRLMYWPSCSADGEYVYVTGDGDMIDPDQVLSTYEDWHDVGSWPRAAGEAVNFQSLKARQGEPESKPGVVGAFCRVYDIPAAMELIPGVYAEVAGSGGTRFTYCGGSTTGGAVLYDGGRFLYSHHATDPCSNRLVNAFDMIRLHKFGDRDAKAKDGTPSNRLPSFTAMCEFAVADAKVSALMARERHDQAMKDFQEVAEQMGEEPAPPTPAGEEPETDPLAWMQKLDISSQTGQIKNTIDNALIIMDNDERLKGRFALNQFAGRGEVRSALPWDPRTTRRLWSDTDNNGLYWYMEKVYGVTGRGNIDAALDVHAASHAFNDVQDFLRALRWDGTPRLDTLLVDYLGADDTPYTRAVTRKAFAAAVARAMDPGCKFDNMLILCGPQGIGKSTLLDRMSMGWFNDSIRTFEGKDASELLQGVWIVEVAELDAFRRTDVSRIKQFLSLRADRYRAAYGRNVRELPRCCVFFGTCNVIDFLQDTTGNRRFWPVDVGERPHDRTVFTDLTDDTVRQLWAEAKVRWQCGEDLYLTGAVESEARARQEGHRETDAREGLVEEFASRFVPDDWQNWSLDRRRDWWATHSEVSSKEKAAALMGMDEYVDTDGIRMVRRDRICAIEVLCERFNARERDIKRADSRDINAILDRLPMLKKSKSTLRIGPYNIQRGYVYVYN